MRGAREACDVLCSTIISDPLGGDVNMPSHWLVFCYMEEFRPLTGQHALRSWLRQPLRLGAVERHPGYEGNTHPTTGHRQHVVESCAVLVDGVADEILDVLGRLLAQGLLGPFLPECRGCTGETDAELNEAHDRSWR